MNEKITLKYEDKAVTVGYKVPSLKLRKAIRDIEQSTLKHQISEKLKQLMIEYQTAYPEALVNTNDALNGALVAWALQNGKITWNELQHLGGETPDAIEERELTTVELFRLIVEPSKVADAVQKEWLESEPNSDFWLSQDITVLEKSLHSFRETIGA